MGEYALEGISKARTKHNGVGVDSPFNVPREPTFPLEILPEWQSNGFDHFSHLTSYCVKATAIARNNPGLRNEGNHHPIYHGIHSGFCTPYPYCPLDYGRRCGSARRTLSVYQTCSVADERTVVNSSASISYPRHGNVDIEQG